MGRRHALALASFLCFLFFTHASWADGFDHKKLDQLLHSHVHATADGMATVVDYESLSQSRGQLKSYLNNLSRVSQKDFATWDNNEQLAFLINAYNAWTVELILTQWPDIKSIKDLGGFFSSPWSKAFIPLFGDVRSLDDIEQKLIRGSGRYNDPRIHFAVNCASIGCPALRAEAYNGKHLNKQLNEQMHLFLMDRTRNRLKGDTLQLSSIFKWYEEDFEKGWLGYNSLKSFVLANAGSLDLPDSAIQALKKDQLDIAFLDYDWRLNADNDKNKR